MGMPSAAEVAEKWARRLKAATPDIQAGIKRVSEAPGVKAAKQQNVMLQNLQESVSSGKWAAKVSKVSLQDWQAAAINKGTGRIAAGVDGAKDKAQSAFADVLSDVAATVAEVERTPRGDLNTNIGRAVTMMSGMAARAAARNR
jgi:hypothetical protein